ncbi:MAG: trypsin-like peptidase domain-containing protein, partial [Planctomycetes bacterium]|nr:trypsin-like peptidase domain-containing protein [Planctomycetota bacterium]
GWVVGEDGEVLTCNHALTTEDGGAPDLIDFETHDFQRVIAERVGVEPTVNLAILQGMVWPNGHPRRLPALQWGNSDRLRPGHWLLCFGDPAGPERFLTVGTFVARPSRDCYQDLLSAFYMQAGLVAHPQAYGGPMIDLNGRVVGVLAPSQPAPGKWCASARQGVEFGLPSKIVRGLHEAIRSARSFRSPWLGYAVMSRPEVARTRGMEAYRAMAKPRNGILIENVYDPGPAWAAGIRPGDWLVTFDTTRIFTPVDFQKQLYLRGIGSKVRVEICRDGASRWHELVVEQRPDGATPR